MSAVLPFLMRFWPYLLGGLVVGLLLLRISMLSGALEDKRNELAAAQAELRVQNARYAEMQAQGEARLADARADAASAREINSRQEPVIVRLDEGRNRARGASERCEISETLRDAEGL